MKYGIVLIFLFPFVMNAQIFGKDLDISGKERIKQTFWSNSADGHYLGYGLNRELGVTSQTITLKSYVIAYYILFNSHIGYKRLQGSEDEMNQVPKHNINFGTTFYFFGADVNYYFGNDRSFLTLLPKISIDFGQLTFEYGYQLGKVNAKPHTLKFSYSLLLKKAY